MDEHRKNTAVARWWAQAAYASYLEGLKKLAAERIPAEDEFDVMAEPAAESSPHDMGYWRSAWESGRLKPDWRQDARDCG